MDYIQFLLSGEAAMQVLKYLNQKRSQTVRRFITVLFLISAAPTLTEALTRLFEVLK